MKFENRKYWGVSHFPSKEWPKDFGDDNEAFEKAMEERTAIMLAGGSDPVMNYRSGRFVAYVYIHGKIRHLGTSKLIARAARLHDSALFYLWGFFRRPKASRFNTPPNTPPEYFPAVAQLREHLIAELQAEGTNPALYDYNYQQHCERLRLHPTE